MGIVRSAVGAALGGGRRGRGSDAAASRRRAGRARRFALAALASLALGLAALAVIGSWLAEEPVRRLLEGRMNERLAGYQVAIGRLDLEPLAFRFAARELRVTQNEHPEPPVAQIVELSTSVEWRALLRGALVADVTLDRPIVYVDRRQARREARDETPLHERGWQDALEAMVPLEIDLFRVTGGEATYVDEGPFEPLRLTGIEVEAANIRNIASRDREYPSRLALDARVFEAGRLELRGHADFLAKPQPGIQAEIELEGIALDYLKPLLERRHFEVRDGNLALSGEFELGKTVRRFELRELVLSDLAGDYVRSEASEAKEPAVARQAVRAAREAIERPELQLRADRIEVRNANVGMRNAQEPGGYRVFLSRLDVDLENFSNRFSAGTGRARLRGRFMGSGATDMTATFEPERSGPEFELALQIVDTDLRAMNDLLRAHGKLDVAEGLLSVYSEIRVADGRIRGYVKPLFREVDVHDPEQDRRDSLVSKAYESLAGGLGKLLENRPRDEVALETDLSGPLEDPETHTWQLIMSLIENAFVRAILPGFEQQVGRKGD